MYLVLQYTRAFQTTTGKINKRVVNNFVTLSMATAPVKNTPLLGMKNTQQKVKTADILTLNQKLY